MGKDRCAVLSLAVRKANQADALVWFYEAMSYDLPFPDAHFDSVVSSLFFHHLSWDDKERTGKEIYRVRRSGAQLHMADRIIGKRGLFVSLQNILNESYHRHDGSPSAELRERKRSHRDSFAKFRD